MYDRGEKCHRNINEQIIKKERKDKLSNETVEKS
jgi:hypothetical protein